MNLSTVPPTRTTMFAVSRNHAPSNCATSPAGVFSDIVLNERISQTSMATWMSLLTSLSAALIIVACKCSSVSSSGTS